VKQREGYLIIDHRASPGIPEEQALRAGLPPALTREGRMVELATLTCNHCKIPQVKNPDRVRERAHCPRCDKYLCDLCGKAYRETFICRPWDQVVDEFNSGKTPTPLLARPIP
jgi:hypothetical protein